MILNKRRLRHLQAKLKNRALPVCSGLFFRQMSKPFSIFGVNMKKVVWLFVVRWIKNSFVGKEDQESSTIVDICMYLEDSFTRMGVKYEN